MQQKTMIRRFALGDALFKMNSVLRPLLAYVILLLLTECTTSDRPTLTHQHVPIAPVAADQGRIFFYRAYSFYSSVAVYAIDVDGVTVDYLASGGCFSVDKPPGKYKISIPTTISPPMSGVERPIYGDVTVTLAAGETIYVRTDLSVRPWGSRMLPSIIDPRQALKEIAECGFNVPKPLPRS